MARRTPFEKKSAVIVEPEIWCPVVGFEEWYSVSSHGRVRGEPRSHTPGSGRTGRPRRGRVMRLGVGKTGYVRCSLKRPGSHGRKVLVHGLVAEAFIGPRPLGMQVNHKSGDKGDNTPGNLEYLTPLENVRHKIEAALRLDQSGENHSQAKLTADAVLQMRAEQTRLIGELSERYGICRQHVSRILRGHAWANLAARLTEPQPQGT